MNNAIQFLNTLKNFNFIMKVQFTYDAIKYFCTILVLGGNQRDLAREKNQKKQSELAKKKAANDKNSNKGMTLEQRKQRLINF